MIFHRKCFTIARSIVTTGYGGPRRFVSSLSIVLKPGTLYSTDERTRNQCIHRALEEWKRLGFKNEGACCVEITYAAPLSGPHPPRVPVDKETTAARTTTTRGTRSLGSG